MNFKIECPFCQKKILGKYTPRKNGSMARLYWYCRKCKLSVTQAIRKEEERKYEK